MMNFASSNVGSSSAPIQQHYLKMNPFAIAVKNCFPSGSQAIFLCQLCAVFLDGRRIVDSNKPGGSVKQTGSCRMRWSSCMLMTSRFGKCRTCPIFDVA